MSWEPGGGGDIELYLIEVRFEAWADEAQRHALRRLPTSFVPRSEQVDQLRDAGRKIVTESKDFKQLLTDLER